MSVLAFVSFSCEATAPDQRVRAHSLSQVLILLDAPPLHYCMENHNNLSLSAPLVCRGIYTFYIYIYREREREKFIDNQIDD